MININLIPDEYRRDTITEVKKKENDLFGIVLKSILGSLCVFLIIYAFFIYVPLKNARKAIENDKDSVKKMTLNVEDPKNSAAYNEELKSQYEIIQKLKATIVWSRKLNILSDSVPVQVQLRSIYLQTREGKAKEKVTQKVLTGGQYKVVTKEVETTKKYHTLEIQGEVLAVGGENIVGQLIDSLNSDADFAKDFEYIKLISILSKGDDKKVFSIRAKFKKDFLSANA